MKSYSPVANFSISSFFTLKHNFITHLAVQTHFRRLQSLLFSFFYFILLLKFDNYKKRYQKTLSQIKVYHANINAILLEVRSCKKVPTSTIGLSGRVESILHSSLFNVYPIGIECCINFFYIISRLYCFYLV